MTDPGDLLLRLLEAYSPSGDERRGTEAFSRVAQALGFEPRTDRVGNGIASRGRGRPVTVYLGHIDTVEGELPVRREGSRVYGRGACDAKGPLLAALLAGADFSSRGEILVVGAVGEETDSRGVRALLPSLAPDYVIGGEPSGWEGLALGYKGDLRVRATFRGSRKHLSSPEPSTVERALAWIERARPAPTGAAGRFHARTSKLERITTREHGGEEQVEAVLDLRLPPGESARSVRDHLPEMHPGDSLETLVEIDPYLAPRSDPVVRALTLGIRRVGGEPTLFKKTGTSDLNLAAPTWGTGGAAYGPGDSHLDHTDEESLDLDELDRAVRVLRHAFDALSSEGPRPTPRPPASDAG